MNDKAQNNPFDGSNPFSRKFIKRPTNFSFENIKGIIPERFQSYAQSMHIAVDRPELKVLKTAFYGPRDVCLKLICCDDDEKFRRAIYECEVTELFRGTPGIVWLLDCDIDYTQKRVALLEEKEISLADFFNQNDLEPLNIVHIGTGILDSLLRIKKAGFLYIDIHPGNLYYNEKHVKIGDFGSVLKLEEVPEYHGLTGAKNFMAPEVWKEKVYSEQSVIYSTGMVLYWIMNRCTPPFMPIRTNEEAFEKRMAGEAFPDPQILQKYPEFMEPLYSCIKKMTAYNPADRYESFDEARKALAVIGYDFLINEMEHSPSISFYVGNGEDEI